MNHVNYSQSSSGFWGRGLPTKLLPEVEAVVWQEPCLIDLDDQLGVFKAKTIPILGYRLEGLRCVDFVIVCWRNIWPNIDLKGLANGETGKNTTRGKEQTPDNDEIDLLKISLTLLDRAEWWLRMKLFLRMYQGEISQIFTVSLPDTVSLCSALVEIRAWSLSSKTLCTAQ